MNALRAAILRGARATRRPGSAAPGARAGDGLVFDRLRAYVEGDDPRHIDPAATARSGALHTRLYREETALLLAAIVDESASMRAGRRRALADAARDALRAWFAVAQREDRIARFVDGRIVRDRRAAAVQRASLPSALETTCALALRTLPHGASLLLVTDGFEVISELTLVRLALRFDATVLLAVDPWSHGLPLRGVVAVADAETAQIRRLMLGARATARYRDASRRRSEELHARYRRAGWRVGELREDDGRASLHRAFGLAG